MAFAYVPKVACSNWKCIMRYLEGYENYLDTAFAHSRRLSGLRYINKEPEKLKILFDRQVKKFACVRDPYSRILSAYLNKVESRLLSGNNFPPEDFFLKIVSDIQDFWRDNLPTSEYPKISFEVFLLWIRDSNSYFTQDEHWRPQSELLCIDSVNFNFIGRFETLAVDAQHILSEMNCDIPFPSQKNIKFAPTNANAKIGDYYSPAAINILNEIYAPDFANLNYTLRH